MLTIWSSFICYLDDDLPTISPTRAELQQMADIANDQHQYWIIAGEISPQKSLYNKTQ
ncbi:hypothetical protein ACE38W_07535 [Chitinophaga sp. Hz27]|uniref:hypothetical protein n=1 Tax=Chitinophaga sp. Hz27 TaxID=3347169 RepID=UPI0035E19DAA